MNIDLDRGDTLPTDLASDIQADHSLSIPCHMSCVSTYTSKLMIRRHLKTVSRSSSEPSPSKRTRFKDPEIFSFQTHCIFCGNTCNETIPKKNPKIWRTVSRCCTADSGTNGKTLKEEILQRCIERGDQWAHDVEFRVLGAVSDLHAADARYHRDSKPAFMAPKSVDNCNKFGSSNGRENKAFQIVVRTMEEDKDRLWTSVEVLLIVC